MMMKILGLDLGTNSIGWTVISQNEHSQIESIGSRIIPMDVAMLSDFDKGNSISQTAQRTELRSVRRLRQRHLLRRERLHRVLNIIDFLPQHYSLDIIFREDNHSNKKYGQFIDNTEPKLAWFKNRHGEFEFLFKDSFSDMVAEFRENRPDLFITQADKKQVSIPYDWTIYYLRKKALTQKVSKEELAWLLMNFNQKRGYYQLRGEDDDHQSEGKSVEFHALKVVDVQATDQKKGKDVWYNVILENGWIYRRSSNQPLDWIGKTKEFIVTTDLEKDGTPKLDKEGQVKRSFRSPKEDDWTLIKKRTENDIFKSGKTVGTYIYDALLKNPQQKIKGALVRVVERKLYKDEIRQIINTQSKFHEQFDDKSLLDKCINELYPNNKEHRRVLCNKNLSYLLIDDILFYQRPLKSKKSLIEDCQYEYYKYTDQDTGQTRTKPIKAIPKSNPIFQEFRLWQFVSNLRIYKKDGSNEIDVTSEFITDIVDVFDWLNNKKEIDQKSFLSRKEFGLKKNELSQYQWNYVADKTYPCNETNALIISRLDKNGLPHADIDYMSLWHILYSVKDPFEIEKALNTFAKKSGLDIEKFGQAFKKCKPFTNDYGSYSEKAIKKLLALMRYGKYWNEKAIDELTRNRINKIITGELDETIDEPTRFRCSQLSDISQFQGLPLHLACYIVYGRHSEVEEIRKWKSPQDIDNYLRSFRQHSLNNPIVEQIVTETLRTVRDIWKQSGRIDEIHVELGREMKNPAAVRKQMSEQMSDNENTNLRIKMLLQAFADPIYEIENVRPHSPSQQSILKIYEDEILRSGNPIPEDIENTIRKFRESDVTKQPSKSEILRYKLWLEQSYRSPYTGAVIPFAKLFTSAYQIEHVIPQSRFFDNSLSNKVICESEINQLKGNRLGLEFITECHGQKVILTGGNVVTIFEVDHYKQFINDHYSGNKSKMKKLLLTETPDSFTNRQMNDTRYISKLIKGLLSNIVREDGEREATSKNVIVCTGDITHRLKHDWGLHDIWNDIVSPRFERLNELTNSRNFGSWVNKEGKRCFQTNIPIELSKGFNKKRIDHRHHALDAVVIACTTRSHVNYLNNENAGSQRHDLKHKLCFKDQANDRGNYTWTFLKPWDTFTQDTHKSLSEMIIGFKQNLRIINKTSNQTLSYNENNKKETRKQTKGENWAIRKSMHKDTVFGRVNLRFTKDVRLSEGIENWKMIVDKSLKEEVRQLVASGKELKEIQKILKDRDIVKTAIYYFSDDKESTRLCATRKSIDTSFDRKKIETAVTDSGIRKILLAHLDISNGDTETAFSPDGIVRMNDNIATLNDGKFHQPIYKVRIYETLGNKFAVGIMGNKSTKYVEAAKGTNLFFAVYQNNSGKRNYATIPLNEVIERLKQNLDPSSQSNEMGDTLLFTLSPNDLVYVPTIDQIGEHLSITDIDRSRIYKMVSSSATQCAFIEHRVAKSIVDKMEYSSQNKMERAVSGEMIKEICIPIKVDRLGNIIKI